jgi:hypothetical protein
VEEERPHINASGREGNWLIRAARIKWDPPANGDALLASAGPGYAAKWQMEQNLLYKRTSHCRLV